MAIAVGDRLPEVTFMAATADGPAPMTTAEAFGGKTVALFSVPGAFTPTCTANHLPPYVAHADAFAAKGATVACTSVNDPFVLGAWAKAGDPDGKLVMLADPAAAFVRALGLTFDGSAVGLGERGLRFSMLVKDGVVSALHVDENPGEVAVSGAETLLAEL